MRDAKAQAGRKREAAKAVDSRLAAFARLLARHAARRDHRRELNESAANASLSGQASREAS